MTEQRAIELKWPEVCEILSTEIKSIVGVAIRCRANVSDPSLWGVAFLDGRLRLPKLCRMLQVTHATMEDWEDALPDEGANDVGGIGSMLAEKLLSRGLGVEWTESLVTPQSFWLVGVRDIPRETEKADAETPRKPGCLDASAL